MLLAIVLYFFIGQTSRIVAKKYVQNEFSKSLNENLPRMIDEITRLDRIIDYSDKIEYKYTIMINDTITDKTIVELNSSIRNSMCKNKLFTRMNKEKAFVYTYMNKIKTSKHSIVIKKKFCKNNVQINASPKSLEQQCIEGNVTICMKLASSYENNGSLDNANDFYQKACNLKSGKACFILANNLKDLFQEDKYKLSCELGVAEGCTAYGILLYERKEEDESVKYLKLGCTKNSKLGCRAMGNFYMKNQKFFKANENYKQACNLRDGFSCNQIGIDYAQGIAVRKDIEKARDYFGLACDYKNKSGCRNYANMGLNWEYRSSTTLYKLPKLIY